MNKNEAAISIEMLASMLQLDADTGYLYWRKRTPDLFKNGCISAVAAAASWNSIYEGRRAFTIEHRGRYFCGTILGHRIFAHRIVFALHAGAWPTFTIDHIDGNGFNNKPPNLRDVPHSENMRNVKAHSDNSTGFIGVSFAKNISKYEARIRVNGRPLIIGYFDSAKDAGAARVAASAANGYHENHGRKSA